MQPVKVLKQWADNLKPDLKIMSTMLLGQAVAEATGIYSFIIAFILIFVFSNMRGKGKPLTPLLRLWTIIIYVS